MNKGLFAFEPNLRVLCFKKSWIYLKEMFRKCRRGLVGDKQRCSKRAPTLQANIQKEMENNIYKDIFEA